MAANLAADIEKILADEVGDFIAKATVKKNCELIGCTPDSITAAHLPQLADKIAKSVSFFSSKEVGNDLSEKIRRLSV